MPKKACRTVVAGDVTVDWLAAPIPPEDPADCGEGALFNWRLSPGTRMIARPGGALLLARLVRLATGKEVVSHHLDELETIPPKHAIHSMMDLDAFPFSSDKKDEKDKKNRVYRVKRFGGFSGPLKGRPDILGIADDDPAAGVVVLDDVGNGFRDEEQAWPAALKAAGRRPIVIYKMCRPLTTGKLWDLVAKKHMDRSVIVISADDLRMEGADISRRLSWERTATDLAWQMATDSKLAPLSKCAGLVVLFGIDGAMLCAGNCSSPGSRLYYDPAASEGDFRDDCPGEMTGICSAFVAAIAARIDKDGLDGVGEGVREGLLSARRLCRLGFGKEINKLDYPGAEIFRAEQEEEPRIAQVDVPPAAATKRPDPSFWCILNDLAGIRLEDAAYSIVRDGESSALTKTPVGRFRWLKTVDRAEIESYRTIRNLMLEYLKEEHPKRPLSIAVFGPPGSGKSFGVSEVAESIAPGRVEKMEFNLSQFGSLADLASSFHKVRDAALRGKVPLVFFDEFDSALGGEALGWLKYFLAPMQDGAFKDGEAMHPVGKAIFVFAGGTSSSLQEFTREALHGEEARETRKTFQNAKGPDFLSRLRGYVNVMGANPIDGNDYMCMIRRAVFLRALLEQKVKHIIASGNRARIDEGVLRAMIKVPEYKHGVRSMEAIIDMSMLAGRKSFEKASLPPAKQLDLHVDSDMFSRFVVHDMLFGAARDKIARAIHEQYRASQKGKKPADDPALKPWDELAEDLKESNRGQADDIPEKLRKLGYGFAPSRGKSPAQHTFAPKDIELLAEMEHERFVVERRRAGWTDGPRDPGKKKSPYLVGWDRLSEEVKEMDRAPIRAIPKYLEDADFKMEKSESKEPASA